MAINKIRGRALSDNLDRNGVDIAVENNLLYVDVDGGRIGINTSTPSQTFEVAGNVAVSGTLSTSDLVATTASFGTFSASSISFATLTIGNVTIANNNVSSDIDLNLVAGPTGNVYVSSQIKTVSNPTDPQDAATKSYVDNKVGDFIFTGPNVSVVGNLITIQDDTTVVGTLSASSVDVQFGVFANFFDTGNMTVGANQLTVTATDADLLLAPNGTGTVNVSNARISNLATPGAPTDAANKGYVDGVFANIFTISDGANSQVIGSGDTVTFVGTANQVNVVVSATDTVTLSLPQSIGTTSSPTFGGMTAGNLAVGVTDDNEIESLAGNVTITSAGGLITLDQNVVIVGNLQVNGTTTTSGSNNLTVEEPTIILGGSLPPTSDDNKDRGVQFRYYDTQARLGFFGYDDSTGYFTYIPQATNTSEVFSGTPGDMLATNFRGNLVGNADTATTAGRWTTARTITLGGDLTGNVSIDGSANVTLTATVAANSVALGTDTTGNYVATVAAGTSGAQSGTSGLTITAAAGEGTAATIAHADTSTLTGTYGTAGIASITVDGLGHMTAITTATYLTSESDTLQTVTTRGATTTDAVSFTNATASTSTITGAVTVSGGIGVGGNVYAGALYGPLTGAVTGNVTGDVTGNVSGTASNVTGVVAVANGGTGASDAATARTNLGLGTISTQKANAVAVTGGTINGTSLGATTRSTALFTTLGANSTVSFTQNSAATSTTTGTLRVTGGVGVSGNVYAGALYGPLTGDVTGNVSGNVTGDVTGNVSGTASNVTGTVAIANGGTGATDAATARTNLGVAIGSNVQAWDVHLDQIAALAVTDNNFIVANGTAWVVESGATARTSLGLGTIATQNANAVAVTGGSVNGTTIGATTRSTGAFTTLTANNATTLTANTASTTTATGTLVVTGGVGVSGNVYAGALYGPVTGDVTGNVSGTASNVTGTVAIANGGTGATDAATARTNLGVAIGSNVQAWDVHLDQIAALAVTDSNFIVGNGTAWVVESGATARTSLGLGTMATQNSTAISVTGGTINGISVGATTRSTGAFTTLTSNGATTMTANTASTSTTTGTLVVTGGVGVSGNVYVGGTMFGTATAAQYADLAENYAGDRDYAPGTVVEFGGESEVTVCDHDHCTRVAGVVSTSPAYLMNSHLDAEHVVAVAFTGRVPCKVVGPVRKGDLMVSAGNGRARAESDPKVGSVIGKALENFDGAEGVIEVVVGR